MATMAMSDAAMRFLRTLAHAARDDTLTAIHDALSATDKLAIFRGPINGRLTTLMLEERLTLAAQEALYHAHPAAREMFLRQLHSGNWEFCALILADPISRMYLLRAVLPSDINGEMCRFLAPYLADNADWDLADRVKISNAISHLDAQILILVSPSTPLYNLVLYNVIDYNRPAATFGLLMARCRLADGALLRHVVAGQRSGCFAVLMYHFQYRLAVIELVASGWGRSQLIGLLGSQSYGLPRGCMREVGWRYSTYKAAIRNHADRLIAITALLVDRYLAVGPATPGFVALEKFVRIARGLHYELICKIIWMSLGMAEFQQALSPAVWRWVQNGW